MDVEPAGLDLPSGAAAGPFLGVRCLEAGSAVIRSEKCQPFGRV